MTPAADAEPAPSRSNRLTRPASHAAGPDADDPLSPGLLSTTSPNKHANANAEPLANARSLRVTLLLETADTDPPAADWIEPLLDRAIDTRSTCPTTKPPTHALTLVLVDDERMADLHLQYTHTPGTTDVLTFDHNPPTPTKNQSSETLNPTSEIEHQKSETLPPAPSTPTSSFAAMSPNAKHTPDNTTPAPNFSSTPSTACSTSWAKTTTTPTPTNRCTSAKTNSSNNSASNSVFHSEIKNQKSKTAANGGAP